MKSSGLVLGKFAPLHRGHQLLIETSLAETEHTIVLIYDCPEIDTPPLTIRSGWIRHLYPEVEVLEAWDGPEETGLDPSVTQSHDAYLQKRLGARRISHFFSSEEYGEHVSRGLGAVDRRIDPDRIQIPVSASLIRQNPFVYREFISPFIYRDLITKIVFVGAPSTGKTTLARELASRFQTVWMPEYGREYWEQHQTERRLNIQQLTEIAVEHRRREDQLIQEARGVMFIDTDATTTLQFSYYYHSDASRELVELARQARERYDLFFLCMPDIPFDDTWDRSGAASRREMHRRIVSDLEARKTPFYPLTGNLAERCLQVENILHQRAFQRKMVGNFFAI